MANPQLENGYTKIANEILDHFVMPGISGSEYRIAIFVLRKTYGFNKKSDVIALSQFQKATLMGRGAVVGTIRSLVHKRVLHKEKNTYSINKNWETWVVHKRVPSTQSCTGVVHNGGTKVVHNRVHTKETTKENIQKKVPATIPFDSFWSLYPKKVNKKLCETLWLKLPLILQEAVMADIPRRMKGRMWSEDGGKYIPHPATYLRGERWTDQIEEIMRKPTSITIR